MIGLSGRAELCRLGGRYSIRDINPDRSLCEIRMYRVWYAEWREVFMKRQCSLLSGRAAGLRLLAAVALTASLLSACGGKGAEAEGSKSTAMQSAETAAEGSAETKLKEKSEGKQKAATALPETQTAAEQTHFLHPIITIKRDFTSSDGNTGAECRAELCEVSLPTEYYPGIGINEAEQYSALSRALSDYYEREEERYAEWYSDLISRMYEYEAEGFTASYSHEQSAVISRADDKVLSVRCHVFSYEGGVHGMYSMYGENFDVQTGKMLSLPDVIRDADRAGELIYHFLRAEYPELNITPESYGPDYFREQLREGYENVGWAMDYSGVTIFYPPYELGSYADGLQVVTLSSAAHPEIFNPEYIYAGQDFITPLNQERKTYVDLDGDGELEGIQLYGSYDAAGDWEPFSAYTINVDGRGYPYSFDTPIYGGQGYILYRGGKYYLYYYGSGENDYSGLFIYELSADKAPVLLLENWNLNEDGALRFDENQGFDWIEERYSFTDPQCTVLSSGSEVLSTVDVDNLYQINEKGLPEVLSSQGFIPEGRRWDMRLKRELEVSVLDDEGNISGRTSVPAGTRCQICRVGLEDRTADLIFYGEKTLTGRVQVELDNDWMHSIDGVDIHEIFDGLIFVG